MTHAAEPAAACAARRWGLGAATRATEPTWKVHIVPVTLSDPITPYLRGIRNREAFLLFFFSGESRGASREKKGKDAELADPKLYLADK